MDEILDERLSGNASPEASPEASPWDASTSTPARRDRPGDDLYESFHEASVFEEQRFDSPAADLLRPAADLHEASTVSASGSEREGGPQMVLAPRDDLIVGADDILARPHPPPPPHPASVAPRLAPNPKEGLAFGSPKEPKPNPKPRATCTWQIVIAEDASDAQMVDTAECQLPLPCGINAVASPSTQLCPSVLALSPSPSPNPNPCPSPKASSKPLPLTPTRWRRRWRRRARSTFCRRAQPPRSRRRRTSRAACRTTFSGAWTPRQRQLRP